MSLPWPDWTTAQWEKALAGAAHAGRPASFSEGVAMGGEGSGNFSHAGRPGEVGGSGPGGEGSADVATPAHLAKLRKESAEGIKAVGNLLGAAVDQAVENQDPQVAWDNLDNGTAGEIHDKYLKEKSESAEVDKEAQADVDTDIKDLVALPSDVLDKSRDEFVRTAAEAGIHIDPDTIETKAFGDAAEDDAIWMTGLRSPNGIPLSPTDQGEAQRLYAEISPRVRGELIDAYKSSDDYQERLAKASDEIANYSWDHLSDKERYQYGVKTDYLNAAASRDEMYPDEWKWDQDDPLNSDDADYRHSGAIARELTTLRAEQLFEKVGLPLDVDNGGRDPASLNDEIWAEWKRSSTSPTGLAFREATSQELDAVGLMTDPQRESAREAAARHFASPSDVENDVGEEAYAKMSPSQKSDELTIMGMKRLRAIARAQWETTQYVLEKSGTKELNLYRAIMLPKEMLENEATERVFSPADKQFEGNYPGLAFQKLSNVQLKRNGLESTTLDIDTANSWLGSGNVPPGAKRVVIRYKVPREAVLSVPVFGKNIAGEREVVMLGARDAVKWDAWLDRAPTHESVPVKFSEKPPTLELDVFQADLDAGVHWLRKPVYDAALGEIAMGGAGSGNFGHAGRPGEVGGSGPGGGGDSTKTVFHAKNVQIPKRLKPLIASAVHGISLEKTAILDALPAHEVQKIKDYLAAGESVRPEFADLLRGVGEQFGFLEGTPSDFQIVTHDQMFVVAPIKSLARTAEKAVIEKDGVLADVKDIVRGTFVVKDIAEARAVLDTFQKSGVAHKVTDRFAKPAEGGYRDIKFVVVLSNGMTGEVQISTPNMLRAKNSIGHKLYEQMRNLPHATDRYRTLLRRSEIVYARAWLEDEKISKAGPLGRVP